MQGLRGRRGLCREEGRRGVDGFGQSVVSEGSEGVGGLGRFMLYQGQEGCGWIRGHRVLEVWGWWMLGSGWFGARVGRGRMWGLQRV